MSLARIGPDTPLQANNYAWGMEQTGGLGSLPLPTLKAQRKIGERVNRHWPKPQMSTTATEVALQDAGHGLGHRFTAQNMQPLSSHFPLLSSAAEEADGASDWEPSFMLQLLCAKRKMRAEQRKCKRRESSSADLGGHLSFSSCSDPLSSQISPNSPSVLGRAEVTLPGSPSSAQMRPGCRPRA